MFGWVSASRVALTVVAGVGGVVALVIAYRRQRDLEQSRFVERFGAAAGQLGATDVAVRIAGVYAMAGVADEADDVRRQQCIDVLCGYLRLPYDAEHGGSGRTKVVIKVPRVDHGQDCGEIEEHIEYRQNDREVRKTIVRVIADHLQPEAEHSWSASNFDFRTAYLEDADFSGVNFSGTARFDGSTFDSDARFDGATFGGDARFGKANFGGDARFGKAEFRGTAWFGKAAFGGDAGFSAVIFGGDADFGQATLGGDARFGGAEFSGDAWFGRATFGGTAWFDESTFGGEAGFGQAIFGGTAWFGGAAFGGYARFGEAAFGGYARFDSATFGSDAGFDNVAFEGRTSFVATDFGSERITFTEPRQWGPPSPEFDWGEDGVGKPVNVEPQDWPPALAAS
ncbi:pentapeptide repeat-containing protein [Nocardia sp. CA-119907]|uniref:pentapeptide repeat-containing protein n=1 Tax=Nocardia sp. CA-119907 TaxID=3239973 RepID=UPI003D966212